MDAQATQFPTFDSFKIWFDEKTRSHPFKTGKIEGQFLKDFVQGKVPIAFLKQYVKQNYFFIQNTNASLAWTLVNHLDLWRRHPDLYNMVAAKIGEEFCDPAPGGHGRTYIKFARYLGLKDEELIHAKPILEMEIRWLNVSSTYRSHRPTVLAVSWIMEGFVGYDMKLWRDILHDKYSIPDEFLEFFDIHVKADLEEHGPMGEMLLARLYELGLVQEQDYDEMRAWVDRIGNEALQRARGNSWRDAIYLRFCANHVISGCCPNQ